MIGSGYKKACLLILATGAFLCAFSPSARANERQYKIEAAFLYNFFNYITCPSLKDAMDKLRVTSQRAPEPTEAQSLAQADQTAKEMEEVL